MWIMMLVLSVLVPQSVQAALEEDRACRQMIYALLDRSGSYQEQHPKAVEDLKRVVARLQAGDCLVLKSIGAESFGDQNTLLPPLELPPSSRPFDPAHRRSLAQRKIQALKTLEELNRKPMEPSTDLWCSLYAASRILQHRQGKKHLLLFTDFRENRWRKSCRSLRLDGVTVEARLIPRFQNEDPAVFERRLRFWVQAFKEAGAASVAFFDKDGLPLLEER